MHIAGSIICAIRDVTVAENFVVTYDLRIVAVLGGDET